MILDQEKFDHVIGLLRDGLSGETRNQLERYLSHLLAEAHRDNETNSPNEVVRTQGEIAVVRKIAQHLKFQLD